MDIEEHEWFDLGTFYDRIFRISTEFYNPEKAKKLHPPRAENVGELIKQLERLPKELPLSGWPENQTHEVVVYNISEHNPHVTIEEVDI